MNDYPSFLGSEFADDGAAALFQLLPVPLEKSVSFGTGTRCGPQKLLAASQQLEIFDGVDIPGVWGLATQAVHSCQDDVATVLRQLRDRIIGELQRQRIPIMLGGEHSLSIAAFQALAQLYPATDVAIVQIDAHADLRSEYQNNPYSHACALHWAYDLGLRIHQLGVRSLSPAEHHLRQNSNLITFQDARELCRADAQLQLPDDFPSKVYLTLDVDGLDPAVIPGTGTPEPGGLGWYCCLQLLEQLAQQCEIIAFDIVELVPEDNSWLSAFTAARLCYQIIGMIGRQLHGKR